jgi:hypothetical protein
MNLNYNNLLKINPFSLNSNIKDKIYLKYQRALFKHHFKHCKEFKKISKFLFTKPNKLTKIVDYPYLHVSLFKKFNLFTKYNTDETKTYTSSGTSGNLSKISLDRKTSLLQSSALRKIFSNLIKNRDSQILFVENTKILEKDKKFSARGAAINGFCQLVDKHYFLLDENKKLKLDYLKDILRKNKKKNLIIFGFTSDIWTYLLRNSNKRNLNLKFKNTILIHGGGWKKLENQSVGRKNFNKLVKKNLGISKTVNYYGMIEQTGSIYLECEKGFFHCSIFSDVFIRDNNLKILSNKKEGIIQTLSLLPLSYPGHNILTEDQGIIHGVDDCKCGKLGKYFSLTKRVIGTEKRGCSDVD